ncbi:MAG: hypothetical protein PHQ90_01595 [Sulfuricurvum sp.]|uniref:hypothetical protein n=1 Tax=Sulfuricurvum sp. TaxID=2025608 RepID=UPI00261197BB|nr:hypothetical protein [Sulfuricurvum sp.]MDD2367963.1 hypothetical protein [Sulfuricurvum sp.]MDD2949162.1 hypothetical protein [Sulfuricurvum sp.]MDD5118769.1 hypothetical protein [Sulfuricurvum sp.]
MMQTNLSSTSARAHAQRSRPTHQAYTLSKMSSSLYSHQGEQVYLLDTYTKMGKRVALVMDSEDENMYEVFYDQLEAS